MADNNGKECCISLKQAAERLRLSEKTVRRYIKRKLFIGRKPSGKRSKLVVVEKSLNEFLKNASVDPEKYAD